MFFMVYLLCVFSYRADGACRHTAAALYAIEDHDVKSVTDGPAVWVRRNTACEEAEKLTNLPAIQARLENIYFCFLRGFFRKRKEYVQKKRLQH